MKELSSKFLVIILVSYVKLVFMHAQTRPDWEGNIPEGCTTITLGKKATVDGSVITSHTDDSHRTRSWIDIQPRKEHPEGSMVPMFKRLPNDSLAMPTYVHRKIGEIPQAAYTNAYVNSAYPCMNQCQVGIGESTFGGREELQSDEGL
ncbi:MAG: peptidase C69, partial [Bacteroides sp. SM23_62]